MVAGGGLEPAQTVYHSLPQLSSNAVVSMGLGHSRSEPLVLSEVRLCHIFDERGTTVTHEIISHVP